MESIATGSPLIRIMVKSIAGIAWGPVHASVYTSEVNSPALKQSGHLLKENRDSLQYWGPLRYTGEDRQRERRKKGRGFSVIEKGYAGFLTQSFNSSISQGASKATDLNLIHRRDSATKLFRCCHISPPLRSDCSIPPLSLDPSISPRNGLSCRAAVMCLLTAVPFGRRETQVEGRSELISLKHGFRLPVQHITVPTHELWHCPEDNWMKQT